MGEAQEARRLGDALGTLRRERGLSQAEAGARIGMTSQGWSLYESGKRAGLFRPDVQRKLTSALDATPEDLRLVLRSQNLEADSSTELMATGVQARGRSYEGPTTLPRQRWTLTSNEMAPWASAGVIIEYVQGQWPRAGQGCVIDLKGSARLVRLFESTDEASVSLRDANGGRISIARDEVASIGAVVARLDEN